MLWEALERKIPYHNYIFTIQGNNIYPDNYDTIASLISQYTIMIDKETDRYWERNHFEDYTDENDNEESRVRNKSDSRNFRNKHITKKLKPNDVTRENDE